MKTNELLTLQALKLKQLNTVGHTMSGALVDRMIDSSPEAKEKLRNICAFITPKLFEDIENLCGILDLSKRQFVEMALRDLVEKAEATLSELDVHPEA